jgi:ATP-dependent NAD(P)H-hydrate dehydratase
MCTCSVPHFLGELDSLLERLHVLVMGPGLGREEFTGLYFREALQRAKLKQMFIVLDADALWHICNRPPLIQGYRRALLTPNIVEFRRLCDSVGVPADVDEGQKAAMLSKALGGPTILQKGPKDIIAVDTTGEMDLPLEERIREIVEVDHKGGLKRCGGQGDILSGMAGALLAWAKCYEDGVFGYGSDFSRYNRLSLNHSNEF